MKKQFTILLTVLLGLTLQLRAANYTSTIEVKKGESWWGVFAGGNRMQPFAGPFAQVDVSDWTDGQKVPMLISSAGRYIWSGSPFKIEFTGDSFVIESDAEKVDAVVAGKTLREAYLVCCHTHFPPTGNTPSPELFIRPVYYTRSELGFGASGEALIGYARKIVEEGYPAGTLVVSSGWQSEVGSFRPSRALYPDFAGTVKALHDQGFKVMLTVTPFVSGDGTLFREHRGDGYFMTTPEGKTAVAEWEGGVSACYDLTNPKVAGSIRERLDSLHRLCGVDGFLFDCAEAIPSLGLARESAKGYMDKWSGLSEGFDFCQYTFSRGNGFAPYVLNRPVDTPFGWDFLQHSASAVVTAGLLGYPYTTAGAGTIPLSSLSGSDDPLLVRYMQLSTVLPVMNIVFAPWRIGDPATAAHFREAVNLRTRIGEYISTLVTASGRTAEPLIRHLEYEFPRNGFADCADHFMIGSKYLVAPLLGPEKQRTVRFPKGVWIDMQGRRYKGPLVKVVSSPDGRPLVFEASK